MVVDDLPTKIKEWEDEVRALLVIWKLEDDKKELFHTMVVACYSFLLQHKNLVALQNDVNSEKGIFKITIMKEMIKDQLKALIPVIRKLVPSSVTDDEFNEQLIVIIEYLDGII